ncbi:MAG: hypothetical protein LBE70_04965, partial [Nitrososphaerota archaeon]|nr:hypothetical protein [Nitrososphaerota archaeon]
VKQTHIPTTENLFKNPLNTSTATVPKGSVENLSINQVVYRQPKNKPIDLLDMQKRDYEEKSKW